MNPSPRPPDDIRRLDREAAAWLVKKDHGFTAAEQDAFFQWLAADPRHGEWFARHRQTWKEFNLLAEWKPEHSTEPNADLLAKSVRARAPVIRWAWFGGLAAAAALTPLSAGEFGRLRLRMQSIQLVRCSSSPSGWL